MRTDGVCPLYVRCTLNGQRFEVATGFMVHHENWNESKQLIKGRTEDVKIINNLFSKSVIHRLKSVIQVHFIFWIESLAISSQHRLKKPK